MCVCVGGGWGSSNITRSFQEVYVYYILFGGGQTKFGK